MGSTWTHALVTGGAGFIGSALVESLIADGVHVCVLDARPADEVELVARFGDTGRLTYRPGDVLDADLLDEAVADQDVVFHLASNTENRGDRAARMADVRLTLGGTVALLEALARRHDSHASGASLPTVVLTSTQLVYEGSNIPITERTGRIRPTSRFAAGKVSAEAFLHAYAAELDFPVAVCRLSNIVGPSMRRGIVYDLVRKVADGPAELRVLGNGRQTRSYLAVDDCVRALRVAAKHATPSVDVFNVCNEDATSAFDVAKIVATASAVPTLPVKAEAQDNGWRGDVATLAVEPERLRQLGWRPTLGSDAAVRETVQQMMKGMP